MTARLSTEEMADLCALADGTLPVERRAVVEARVAASPELRDLVERQRRAVARTASLSQDAPPPSLVEAVEALRLERPARRARGFGLAPRLALAGGLAAVVAIVAAVVLSGGPGAPSVAEAARLADKPANAPAPQSISRTKLAANVEGVAFPNFAYWTGWHTLGMRRGRVDGRDASVVFYGKDGKRIGYVIVAGSALPRPAGGQSTTRHGVEYQTLLVNGRPAVTWRRAGRTCVLIGEAARPELLKLAAWRFTLPS